MNRAILKFTAMSCFLDRIKVVYVIFMGLVIPVGMKWETLSRGAAESQTFEMFTGSVGVALVLTGLCLGAAGTSTSRSAYSGECLPLIFSRPLTRAEYVVTKWCAIALVCGAITALQNILVAFVGMCFGEVWTVQIIGAQVLERLLDAGILSAAFLATMLARNRILQVFAMAAFYVWLVGQTLPPVSVAGPNLPGLDGVQVAGGQMFFLASHRIGDFLLPGIHVYEAMNALNFPWIELVCYVSTLLVYLFAAVAMTTRRDFFYGTD